MLISEAFDLYRKAEVIAGGLSRKTDESYLYASKLATKFFSDVEIEKIMAEDVRDFYEHLLGWQKPDTARGNIVCLRSVIGYLDRKGYQVLNPQDIKIPKREKREITFLTEPEFEQFLEVVGEKRRGYAEINRLRNIAIVELLFVTGIRVSELCRLNRNSIRNRQFVTVGKSRDPRPCYITERVEKHIKEYLRLRTDSNPALFIANQTERRITAGNVRRIFQNVCARSDFEGVHPHTLRHSFATYLIEHGVDILYVSEMMGHTSLETTKIYTHYSNPKLKKIHETAFADKNYA